MSNCDSNIIPLSGPLVLPPTPFKAPETEAAPQRRPRTDPRGPVNRALAILKSISFGELLSALPADEVDRRRHATAMTLLDVLEQELTSALAAIGAPEDDREAEDL